MFCRVACGTSPTAWCRFCNNVAFSVPSMRDARCVSTSGCGVLLAAACIRISGKRLQRRSALFNPLQARAPGLAPPIERTAKQADLEARLYAYSQFRYLTQLLSYSVTQQKTDSQAAATPDSH